jgi:hypothetical protein
MADASHGNSGKNRSRQPLVLGSPSKVHVISRQEQASTDRHPSLTVINSRVWPEAAL